MAGCLRKGYLNEVDHESCCHAVFLYIFSKITGLVPSLHERYILVFRLRHFSSQLLAEPAGQRWQE